jgi:hypothetical protein
VKYTKYIKKLTPQELGYRKGRLTTGGYFYVSKSAVGSFFETLDKKLHNDSRNLIFNDPLKKNHTIEASYVYHNDLFALDNGTRNEYRIYLNRDLAKHELHFQPDDIVVFERKESDRLTLSHYRPGSEKYEELLNIINTNFVRGNHALL